MTGTTYCMICGDPFIGDQDFFNGRCYPTWVQWITSILIHTCDNGRTCDFHQGSEVTNGTCEAGNFHIEGGEYWDAVSLGFQPPDGLAKYVFHIHTCCLSIFDEFIETVEVKPNNILNFGAKKSISHLYLALEARHKVDRANNRSVNRLLWPHGYYGAFRYQGDEWIRCAKSLIFEAQPCGTYGQRNRLDFMPFIYSRLQRMPAYAPSQPWAYRSFPSNFRRLLPQEVQDMVRRELLRPFENPSLNCLRIFEPGFWRHILISTPWLWDMRLDQCFCKEREIDKHGRPIAWDWELLVRQLYQINAFEPEGQFADAPPELRNRRRIWRILGDMGLESVTMDVIGEYNFDGR